MKINFFFSEESKVHLSKSSKNKDSSEKKRQKIKDEVYIPFIFFKIKLNLKVY